MFAWAYRDSVERTIYKTFFFLQQTDSGLFNSFFVLFSTGTIFKPNYFSMIMWGVFVVCPLTGARPAQDI